MTDQTIPADKVRDLRDQYARLIEDAGTKEAQAYYGHVVDDLDALLPTPKRPTLADMTDDERFNAVGMWADVDGFHPYRAVIDDIPAPKVPVFKPTAGSLDWVHPEDVTPRPELGRAWSPGGSPTGTPAPAPALPDGWRLADHEDHGRVIVTTTPNRNGYVCVLFSVYDRTGHDWLFYTSDELTYLDQEGDTPVPPNTLAVGSVWGDVDALARACEETGRDQVVITDKDGDVFVWGADAEWWEAGLPERSYAPFTILHAGKKADQ